MKVLVYMSLISSLMLISSAQRKSTSTQNRQNNEPVGQGRTLGLIQPLLGLGLNSILRPLTGYDAAPLPAAPYRPTSASEPAESDPLHGSYGYGGYAPNYYNYGGYPLYRPIYPIYRPTYALPFFGGYRPQFFGGYPQYNTYGGQRPGSITHRPSAVQNPSAYPSIPTTSSTGSGSVNPAANSGQAAQIANLLGQLLGQQLRPLLNRVTASTAQANTDIAPSSFADKRYRGRYYQG